MKSLYAILAFCALGLSLYAIEQKVKTHYICAISGPGEVYTTTFATKEECNALCFQKGAPAICEETGPDSTEGSTTEELMVDGD